MKNVFVCLPMDENAQNEIAARLQRADWLKDSKVSFVHVFKEENYPYMVPPTIYPTEEQKVEIKKTIEEIFNNLLEKVPAKSKEALCLFHPNPKEGMVEYIKKKSPDTVISFTKEKHGLRDYFHSSFTEYLIKHAPCDVLTIR